LERDKRTGLGIDEGEKNQGKYWWGKRLGKDQRQAVPNGMEVNLMGRTKKSHGCAAGQSTRKKARRGGWTNQKRRKEGKIPTLVTVFRDRMSG